MPVPTYDKCMLPLLQFANDRADHHIRDAIEAIAQYFELNDEDRNQRLPSGKKYTLDDRVQWANTYLKKAQLLESAGRGLFRITSRGIEVLNSQPTYINKEFLMQFPEFALFQSRPEIVYNQADVAIPEHEAEQTPQERLQASYQSLRDQLAQDLLDTIMACSPSFFENLVLDLLLALGYGGAIDGAGEVVGRPSDNGIDAIIKEDKLGFDVIYVQAKRWDESNTVSRPTVQSFAGSLIGQGAAKGVFITTSTFSKEAVNYANKITQPKIILIDGQQLAKLMIDNNIGVSPIEVFTLKKIDIDYFQVG
jgi:restriction system protein